MDLSPEQNLPKTKAQKEALKKASELEATMVEEMQNIANNLLLSSENYHMAKHHLKLAVMLFRRAISKPNEK